MSPSKRDQPRILILQPPTHLDEQFIDYPPLMPLSTVMTGSASRALGCPTDVLDAGCLPGAVFQREPTGWQWGTSDDAFIEAVRGRDADIVWLSQSVFQYTRQNLPVLRALGEMCQAMPSKPLIVVADQSVGGMHRLDIPIETRRGWLPFADAFATYESDAAIDTFVRAWREGRSAPALVDGFAADLDAVPDPDWGLVDVEAYQVGLHSAAVNRDWLFQGDRRTLPVLTSRGCPFRCNFCFPEAAWKKGARVGGFRAWSTARMGAQLNALSALRVEHLVILDATLNGDRSRFKDLLTHLESGGFTIDIPNGMRADLLDDEDLARLAPMLGELSVSAESGDPEVVQRIVGKRLDLDHIRRVAAGCQRVGLPLSIHWMIGQPGEDETSIKRTLREAWNLLVRYGANPLVQFATPFPGTRLYRESVEAGLLVDDPEAIPGLPARVMEGRVMQVPGITWSWLNQVMRGFRERVARHRETASGPRQARAAEST